MKKIIAITALILGLASYCFAARIDIPQSTEVDGESLNNIHDIINDNFIDLYGNTVSYGTEPPGDTATANVYYVICNAPDFNGTDEDIVFNGPMPADLTGDFILSWTGELNNTGGTQSILMSYTGTNVFGLLLYYTSDTQMLLRFSRSSTSASSGNNVNSSEMSAYVDGDVHTVRLEYTAVDGTSIITIDGIEVANAIMPNFGEAAASTGAFAIGSYGTATNNFRYQGIIYDVSIGDVNFPLNEGADTVYGYESGVQTETGAVTAGSDFWVDSCDP